jgi:hypothetical protein
MMTMMEETPELTDYEVKEYEHEGRGILSQ